MLLGAASYDRTIGSDGEPQLEFRPGTELGEYRPKARLDPTTPYPPSKAGDDTVVIARDVIGLRAQYGIAAAVAGSTTLEDWQNATAAFANLDATTLPRVRALRMGIVTRSPQREKPNATTGDCEASLAKPQVFGVEVEPDVADWQCFR